MDFVKSHQFTRQPVTPEEVAEWRQMGYTHDSFTGEMCIIRDVANSMLFNSIAPQIYSWAGIRFDAATTGLTLYKMKTGDIMPVHVDHFRTYCARMGVDRSRVWRCLVMLEDAKAGHYLEIGKEWTSSWKAGDFFAWSSDTPHAAANIGLEDRYTLQITFISDRVI